MHRGAALRSPRPEWRQQLVLLAAVGARHARRRYECFGMRGSFVSIVARRPWQLDAMESVGGVEPAAKQWMAPYIAEVEVYARAPPSGEARPRAAHLLVPLPERHSAHGTARKAQHRSAHGTLAE